MSLSHRPRFAAVCLVALAAFGLPATGAFADELPAAELQQLEDAGVREIIVRRDPGLTAAERTDLRRNADVTYVRTSRLGDVELVRAPPSELVEAVAELNASQDVRFAEPDGRVRALTNDTFWSRMWGLENTGQVVNGRTGSADADIDAPEAWSQSLGTGQTVAVVDTGALLSHPDLAGQLEPGWDFVGRDSNPSDENGHGTHVTGTIVARKDNSAGIVGVSPSARALPLRVLGADGTGSSLAVAEALDYAGDVAIPIVNASLGGPFSQAIQDAIASHPSTLYVVAGGNDGVDNDVTPTYPCSLPNANVVCVGATASDDTRASFSNVGARSVDIFAPGNDIASSHTVVAGCPSPCYLYLDGTSMASPHVAGILALMRARTPTLTSCQLKDKLLSSADAKPGLAGLSRTGARANANAAVIAAAAPVTSPRGSDPDFDCRGDVDDNCPASANPDQEDRDRDGTGDACDATPDGPPVPASAPAPAPAPAVAVPTAAPTTPAPPRAKLAPVLTQPVLRPANVTRAKPAIATFRLDRSATVRLTASRRSGSRYRNAATVSLSAGKGANRYAIKSRIAGKRLRTGTYRLTVRAQDGALASRAYTLAFTVRSR